MKKNILIITTRFYPDIGGIERSMLNLAQELFNKKFKVTVICTGNKNEITEHNGIRIIRKMSLFKFSGTDINPFLIFEIYNYAKNSDLIIVNEPNPFTNSLFVISNIILKKRYIVYYHSDIIRFGISYLLKVIYQNSFQALLLKMASVIVTTTKRYQEISDTLNKKEYQNKFAVIPCTVNLDELKKYSIQDNEKELFKEQLGVKNKKIILFVGRFIYYKGLEYLIRGFKLLKEKEKNVVLILVGKGPLENMIIREANALALNYGQDYIIKKEVNDELLSKFYQIADVFVLPSIFRSEAFGIVLLEAMAYGIPIVTTNVSGTAEVAEHVGLVVEPRNPETIADSIHQILNNNELKGKFKEEAEKKVQNYDSKKVMENFIDIINYVIDNKNEKSSN